MSTPQSLVRMPRRPRASRKPEYQTPISPDDPRYDPNWQKGIAPSDDPDEPINNPVPYDDIPGATVPIPTPIPQVESKLGTLKNMGRMLRRRKAKF